MIKNSLRTSILNLGASICVLITLQSTSNALKFEGGEQHYLDDGTAHVVITPEIINTETGELIREGEKIVVKSPYRASFTHPSVKQSRDEITNAIDESLAFKKAIGWQPTLEPNQEIVYHLGISLTHPTDFYPEQKLEELQQDIRSKDLLYSALNYGVVPPTKLSEKYTLEIPQLGLLETLLLHID